jgi:uroporphyrinogen-III synthase
VNENRRPDPNKERNDPMVAEYWQLGEDLQDSIRRAGYEADAVEGIAVDVHDLLQAAERIQNELGPRLLQAGEGDREALRECLRELAFEFDHIRWHCDAATEYLEAAERQLAE